MTSLIKIEELVLELIKKVDDLSKELSTTNEKIEAIAAKIINNVSDKIDKKDLKFEKHKEKILETKTLQKYAFPNFNVGNSSLGNSKSLNALTWPFGKSSND